MRTILSLSLSLEYTHLSMSMIIFIILTLIVSAAVDSFHHDDRNEDNEKSIECRNQFDFYFLLYKICSNVKACRSLYYLQKPTTLVPSTDNVDGNHQKDDKNSGNSSRDESYTKIANLIEKSMFYKLPRDFKKFYYQLSVHTFFLKNKEGVSSINSDPSRKDQTMSNLMIQSFMGNHNDRIVTLKISNSSDSDTTTTTPIPMCHTLSENTDLPESFRITALYIMSMYKVFISSEQHCHDYNEELKINRNGTFFCKCKFGKTCRTENIHKEILIVLVVVLIVILIVSIISSFVNIYTTNTMIYKIKSV